MPCAAQSPIRCPYFQEHAAGPCHVIAALPSGLPYQTNVKLKSRYCSAGLFFGCPLFRVVQRRLEVAGELIRRRAEQRRAAC